MNSRRQPAATAQVPVPLPLPLLHSRDAMAQVGRSYRFEMLPDVYRVGEAVRQAGGRPILVGGWVRDTLLGIAHRQDYDIEVFGLPMGRLRNILARLGPVHSVGRHFGVLKLKTPAAEYDVSIPRRESNIGKGHRGFLVEPDPTMHFEEAAARRDFTINAMGYAFLEDEMLDPHGGEADLRARVLRHVGPAFGEDPLRVLRAMQFAGRFELRIAPETLAICRLQDLDELPRERLWEEFKKLLLKSARPSAGLIYVHDLGILRYFPELQHLYDGPAGAEAWTQTLAMTDAAAALCTGEAWEDRVRLCAALTHAMQPAVPPAVPCKAPGHITATPGEVPAARRFLERLTNEGPFIEAVLALLADLATPQAMYDRRSEVRPGEVRRLALRHGLPALVRAARAYHMARSPHTDFPAAQWLEGEARRLEVWTQAPQPILMGRHLLERGVPPGPAIGDWVAEAFERQLDGDIASLDAALAWLEVRLAHKGQQGQPAVGGGSPPGKAAGRGRDAALVAARRQRPRKGGA